MNSSHVEMHGEVDQEQQRYRGVEPEEKMEKYWFVYIILVSVR